MRFHVVALPHTQTNKNFLSCAYTQKVLNFCRMMKSLGHTVYHYGAEGSEVPCDEHISIITEAEQKKWWGQTDVSKEYYSLDWDPRKEYWLHTNARAIISIGHRIMPKDFICLIGGNCQEPIAKYFPGHMSVEYGIGYEGTFSPYRVFESYAHMHYVYGKQGTADGKYYDTVIPNYFDPKDFYISEKKEDYFLYVGRLVKRKGIDVATQVCKKLGAKLKVAGQGIKSVEPGKIVSDEVVIDGDVEYVGTVGLKERAELMSKAKAIFVETQYIGPFEGVSIEAMMSGTPVLSTDWGCFVENNVDGVTGFRTRTLGETIWAAKECEFLEPVIIRDYAVRRFSLDVVKHRYQDYFNQLMGLWGAGWNIEDFNPIDKRALGHFQ